MTIPTLRVLYEEAPLWRMSVIGAGFMTAVVIGQIVVRSASGSGGAQIAPAVPTGPGHYSSPFPPPTPPAPATASAPPPTPPTAVRTGPNAAGRQANRVNETLKPSYQLPAELLPPPPSETPLTPFATVPESATSPRPRRLNLE